MDFQLAGKKAVVTGGNAGIGRAIGRMLAAEGVTVALVGRNQETLESAKTDILAQGSPEPVLVVQDLLEEGAVENIASAVHKDLGQVDILINNSGVARPFGKDANE